MDNHLIVRTKTPEYKEKEDEKGTQEVLLLDSLGNLDLLLAR